MWYKASTLYNWQTAENSVLTPRSPSLLFTYIYMWFDGFLFVTQEVKIGNPESANASGK